MTTERILSSVQDDDEVRDETELRPQVFDDYGGQDRVRENLSVAITATRRRQEALAHVLLYGPPGRGKTTLAHVIGHELGVPVRATEQSRVTNPCTG